MGYEGRHQVFLAGYRVPVRDTLVDWIHVIQPPVLVTERIP